MVDALMASLNSTLTVALVATPVALLVGVIEVTVGAVVSGGGGGGAISVVNDDTALAAIALPARSLMPVTPLMRKIVYDVAYSRGAVGVTVAEFVAAS